MFLRGSNLKISVARFLQSREDGLQWGKARKYLGRYLSIKMVRESRSSFYNNMGANEIGFLRKIQRLITLKTKSSK